MVNQEKQKFDDCICLISYYPFKRNSIYKFSIEENTKNDVEYVVFNDDTSDVSCFSFKEKKFKYIFGDKTYIREKKIVDLID